LCSVIDFEKKISEVKDFFFLMQIVFLTPNWIPSVQNKAVLLDGRNVLNQGVLFQSGVEFDS
jgi:hypothetical protein